MKEFYFLVGLPRSGSTLLATLLRQNQDVYVTSTSPMLDQLVANQDIYKEKLQSTKANYNQTQLDNITLRMIEGIWGHIDAPKIIDNNRGWARNLPSVEILFKKRIKCIAMYRDIPSIMASWLTLIKKNPINSIDQDLINRGQEVNDYNRMMLMWHEQVLDCVESLCSALTTNREDVLLISYDELISNPVDVLTKVNNVIGSDITYSLDKINEYSIPQYDDDAWGLNGLHDVRPAIDKVSSDPKDVLGDELYEIFTKLNEQYIITL
jgi:sulfotransferase